MFFLCISPDFVNGPQILESACKYIKKLNNNNSKNNTFIIVFTLTEEHFVNNKWNEINARELIETAGKVTFNSLTVKKSKKILCKNFPKLFQDSLLTMQRRQQPNLG